MGTPTGRRRSIAALTAGLAAGVALGLAMYGLSRLTYPHSGLILVSLIVLTPAAACALAVVIARPANGRWFDGALVLSIQLVTLMLVAAAIVLREGAICIAMAAPIFYASGFAGAALGTWVSERRNGATFSLLIALTPFAVLPAESPASYPLDHTTVVTAIEVSASPDAVWAEAVEIRHVKPAELHWTVTQDVLGVPKPSDAKLVGDGVGAIREATWGRDIRFDEKIVEWEPLTKVAWIFDIPEKTADRLLDDHLRLDESYLTLDGGSYEITPIAPGRTRLTLRSSYRIRSPFNPYVRLWGRQLLGDIHSNVLGVVKERAEQRTFTAPRRSSS